MVHQASTQPMHRDETLSKRDRWELSKRGLERKLDPAFAQPMSDQVDAFSEAGHSSRPETIGISTTTLQVPDVFGEPSQTFLKNLAAKPEAPLSPGTHRDTVDRTTTQRMMGDPSLALQAQMDATSSDRQRDMRHIIEAFTRTVVSAHPCLVSGPDPPDLAAIAARFLPPSLGTSHHPSSSAPILLDPTLGPIPLLAGPHTCLPQTGRHLCHAVSWATQLDGDLCETEGLTVPVACRGLTIRQDFEGLTHTSRHRT